MNFCGQFKYNFPINNLNFENHYLSDSEKNVTPQIKMKSIFDNTGVGLYQRKNKTLHLL